jgi:hypothetical protein
MDLAEPVEPPSEPEDGRSGRIVLRLEVERDADPIRGSIEVAGGELEFVGWVGLANALGQILVSSPGGRP